MRLDLTARPLASRPLARLSVSLLVLAALAGCGDGQAPEGPTGNETERTRRPEAPGDLVVRSEAFADGGNLPKRHTCDGEEVSPPLKWEEVPEGATELVLLVTDPDAPNREFTHWIVGGLDPGLGGLEEGQVPEDAVEGSNDFNERGYGAPCPPEEDTAHRYVFALYALDEPLGMEPGASVDEIRDALEETALANGELVGTYTR